MELKSATMDFYIANMSEEVGTIDSWLSASVFSRYVVRNRIDSTVTSQFH